MGLFMDADGIPLAFDLFPGNQNEQVTLKPLETKVIRDFECSDFIFCSDAGLGSKNNRFFNSFGNRSYVITYSLKKMKKEERDIAMKPTQFRVPGSNKMIDLRTLDETDETVFNTVYYKEVPLVTGVWTRQSLSPILRNTKNISRKYAAARLNVHKKCFKIQAVYGAEKHRTTLPVLFIKHPLPATEK